MTPPFALITRNDPLVGPTSSAGRRRILSVWLIAGCRSSRGDQTKRRPAEGVGLGRAAVGFLDEGGGFGSGILEGLYRLHGQDHQRGRETVGFRCEA